MFINKFILQYGFKINKKRLFENFLSIFFLITFAIKGYCFKIFVPKKVVQGQGFLVFFETKKERKAVFEWLDKKVPLMLKKGKNEILLGVGLKRKGIFSLKIKIWEDGRCRSFVRKIFVQTKRFPKRRLKVAKRFVSPSKSSIKRILREQKQIIQILDRISRKKFYKLPFIAPLRGKVLSCFGAIRVFNKRVVSVHKGVDFRAPLNSVVKASNFGKIAFAGELYFGGKTVIIDHGLGVFTIYMHLNKILVKKGEYVRKGEKIAFSGKTGRVTGPHLHFGVSILGERVDPLSIILEK